MQIWLFRVSRCRLQRLCRVQELLECVDDYRPRRRGGVGHREVASVDFDQARVLAGGPAGRDIGDTLRERDPVVGLTATRAS